MADTKRLQVKKKLTEWLAGISAADGYNFDLDGKVFRGRDKFSEDDPLPAVAILEPPQLNESLQYAGSGRVVKEELVLLVQGWVAQNLEAEHPTDEADLLLGDLKKRLGMLIGQDLPPNLSEEQHNLFGLVADVFITTGTVRPPDQFSPLAYCYFMVRLVYAEKIDDPYSVS